jgi:hypothetical protein
VLPCVDSRWRQPLHSARVDKLAVTLRGMRPRGALWGSAKPLLVLGASVLSLRAVFLLHDSVIHGGADGDDRERNDGNTNDGSTDTYYDDDQSGWRVAKGNDDGGDWHRAELFPLAQEYKNVFQPPWALQWSADANWDTFNVSKDALSAAKAAAKAASVLPCKEMADGRQRHYTSVVGGGVAHAAAVAAAWVEYEANTLARKTRYCVAQCGYDRCCPSGMVEEDVFEQILGSRASTRASSSSGSAADGRSDGTNDVTLVTQGSADRVATFTKVLAAWEGPVVALFLIYNQTAEDHAQARKDRASVEALAALVQRRANVQILVYTVKLKPGMDYYGSRFVAARKALGDEKAESSKLTLYPVNSLRNAAADRATTNWVFPLDMDFVPSRSLYVWHSFRVRDVVRGWL